MPRRSHKKSRAGCIQCKARHVKCDEEKPICNNCLNHAVECTYEIREESAEAGLSSSRNTRQPSQFGPAELVSQKQLSWRHAANLDMGSLELFHHHIKHLPGSTRSRGLKACIEYTPTIAMKHRFLMHGMLAVSAGHMACTTAESPVKEYLLKSWAHQKFCDRGLREYIALPQQHQDEVAFATGVIVYTLSYCTASENDKSLDMMIRPIETGRGLRHIFEAFSKTAQTGPYANLTLPVLDDEPYDVKRHVHELHSPEEAAHLLATENIDLHFHLLSEACKYGHTKSSERRPIYETLLQRLQNCFYCLLSLSAESRHAFAPHLFQQWLSRVPEEFVEDLRSQRPISLAVFATYAAGYPFIGFWATRFWSVQLVVRVARMLPPEMRTLVSWPLKVVKKDEEFM